MQILCSFNEAVNCITKVTLREYLFTFSVSLNSGLVPVLILVLRLLFLDLSGRRYDLT